MVRLLSFQRCLYLEYRHTSMIPALGRLRRRQENWESRVCSETLSPKQKQKSNSSHFSALWVIHRRNMLASPCLNTKEVWFVRSWAWSWLAFLVHWWTSLSPSVRKECSQIAFVFCFKAEQQALDCKTCRFAACSARSESRGKPMKAELTGRKNHQEAYLKGKGRLCVGHLGPEWCYFPKHMPFALQNKRHAHDFGARE